MQMKQRVLRKINAEGQERLLERKQRLAENGGTDCVGSDTPNVVKRNVDVRTKYNALTESGKHSRQPSAHIGTHVCPIYTLSCAALDGREYSKANFSIFNVLR
ncbi:hypothetical protein PsorP6_001834 [Peronosclerospora sorghi]|uniref:Uncharacterized protein n=1 Tax=Peronosclerospora sorghi TaxID=230839 RepID=A0ACC0WXA4_9STRA|nr:hypothetical protein PsorP6_001834 [Peronosclerospora sorghi]